MNIIDLDPIGAVKGYTTQLKNLKLQKRTGKPHLFGLDSHNCRHESPLVALEEKKYGKRLGGIMRCKLEKRAILPLSAFVIKVVTKEFLIQSSFSIYMKNYMFMGNLCTGTPWARIDQNVKKPSLTANVINFEFFGFNVSIWVPWSPFGPKK